MEEFGVEVKGALDAYGLCGLIVIEDVEGYRCAIEDIEWNPVLRIVFGGWKVVMIVVMDEI